MPDKGEQLRVTLSELHAELESLGGVDPEVRQLLEGAVADIHRVIGPGGGGPPIGTPDEHRSIVGRLTRAARHFEESHPTLAGAVGSVIDSLGRMGI